MSTDMYRPRAESSAQHPPHANDDDSDAERADIIEANSPEGRPGDPGLSASATLRWSLLIIACVILVSVIFAMTQGIIAGLFALVLGLCLGIVANSEVWAAASRAKERHDLDKHAYHGNSHK